MAVGYPDYWRIVQPTKAIGQGGFTDTQINVDEVVAANSSTTITLYTVPADTVFMISSGTLTCDKSCIQKIELFTYNGAVPWITFQFDINVMIIDAVIGTASHLAGWVLKAKFINNLDESVRFIGTLWGNEYTV